MTYLLTDVLRQPGSAENAHVSRKIRIFHGSQPPLRQQQNCNICLAMRPFLPNDRPSQAIESLQIVQQISIRSFAYHKGFGADFNLSPLYRLSVTIGYTSLNRFDISRSQQIIFRNLVDSPSGGSNFNTTCWHVVTSSQDQDSTVRRESLGELYKSYWYPLFAYLRRKGHSTEAASDYVQSFFLELIDKEFLSAVSPDKGRFRWFMMSAIGRFVSKETARQQTQKRGGDQKTFSLNVEEAEQRYQREPAADWSPEKLFDRRWALEVLAQALRKLESEHESKGKIELYRELQGTLAGETLTSESCESIGERLEMSPVAVKVAAHRLKDKYRAALVEVVTHTLADPENVDDELDNLFQALSG